MDDEDDGEVLVGSLLSESATDKPRSIAVHPFKSLVFWVNMGGREGAKIERARYNGEERRVLVNQVGNLLLKGRLRHLASMIEAFRMALCLCAQIKKIECVITHSGKCQTSSVFCYCYCEGSCLDSILNEDLPDLNSTDLHHGKE